MIPRPPSSPLFPYTTLFRSIRAAAPPDSLSVKLSALHPRFEELKRSEEHTSELQSRFDLVCRLLLEKKKMTLLLGCTQASRTSREAQDMRAFLNNAAASEIS